MPKIPLPEYDPQKAHQEKLRRIAKRQEFDAAVQQFVRTMRCQMPLFERWSPTDIAWDVGYGMTRLVIHKNGRWCLQELMPSGNRFWKGYDVKNYASRERGGRMIGYPSLDIRRLRRMLAAYTRLRGIPF